MKAASLFVVSIASLVLTSSQTALAGVIDPGTTVPEPTALLVWAGLAGAGALFYSRRNREG